MRVAIAPPISLRQLANLLNQPAKVPAGQGATPPLPEVRGLIARGHNHESREIAEQRNARLIDNAPDVTSMCLEFKSRLARSSRRTQAEPCLPVAFDTPLLVACNVGAGNG
jgi:hypothetical protein